MRRGRLSNEDRAKMAKLQSEGKTIEQIAKKMGRSEDFVGKVLEPPQPPKAAQPEPEPFKPPTAKDLLIPKGKQAGVVVMTQAASELIEATGNDIKPKFRDCIQKIDPSR